MDIASLMWDETGRDYDHEQRETARTAALADAERLVGQFVYQAGDDVDLGNRLALADERLRAVAAGRGYPLQSLQADLTERWKLLSQARTASAQKTAAARQKTAAAEQVMDKVAASLAAVAARHNPHVPMVECLRLATEAVRKHADAYPLAYESWGGTHDGPITNRVKNFTPNEMPKTLPMKALNPAGDPGASGGDSTFDEASKRLDDLEGKLPGAVASLDATVAGFYQRLKDWWWSEPIDRAQDEMDKKWNANAAAPGASEEYQTAHRSDDLLHGFDQARSEMDKKWDANAAAPGASKEYETAHRSDDLLHGFDQARSEMKDKWDANAAAPGASKNYHPPVPGGFSHAETGQRGTGEPPVRSVVTDFSHPDTGHSPQSGQGTLPTDPGSHGFSDSDSHSPRQRQDWNIPTHFQYGASLFE